LAVGDHAAVCGQLASEAPGQVIANDLVDLGARVVALEREKALGSNASASSTAAASTIAGTHIARGSA
jgi:hypothetical protein